MRSRPSKAPENDQAQAEGSQAETGLAPSQTESDNRRKPKRGCGGYADDSILAPQYRPRADKAHPGENAQRKAHHVHTDGWILGATRTCQQQIGFDHGNRCSEAHQQRRTQPRRAAALPSIQANQCAREKSESKAARNFEPVHRRRHQAAGRCWRRSDRSELGALRSAPASTPTPSRSTSSPPNHPVTNAKRMAM